MTGFLRIYPILSSFLLFSHFLLSITIISPEWAETEGCVYSDGVAFADSRFGAAKTIVLPLFISREGTGERIISVGSVVKKSVRALVPVAGHTTCLNAGHSLSLPHEPVWPRGKAQNTQGIKRTPFNWTKYYKKRTSVRSASALLALQKLRFVDTVF